MSYDIYRIYTDELLTAQCYSVKLIHTVATLNVVKELLATSERHNWLCMAYPAKVHRSNHYQKRGLKPLQKQEMYLTIPLEKPVMATHHATLFLKALERQRRKEGYYATI